MCKEVRFASFLSGGFITGGEVAKRTSVQLALFYEK